MDSIEYVTESHVRSIFQALRIKDVKIVFPNIVRVEDFARNFEKITEHKLIFEKIDSERNEYRLTLGEYIPKK